MSKSDLRKKAEIAPNTMTKLRRDEEVSLTIVSKICKTLNADFGDIVVHVWIRNSKGEDLIPQRSANRPTYPLMWECVGGSVVKGENSLVGAIWEAKEEVGVDLMP